MAREIKNVFLFTTREIKSSSNCLFNSKSCSYIDISNSKKYNKILRKNIAIRNRLNGDDYIKKYLWKINEESVYGFYNLTDSELRAGFNNNNFVPVLGQILIYENINLSEKHKINLYLLLHDKDLNIIRNDYRLFGEQIEDLSVKIKQDLSENYKESVNKIEAYVFMHTFGDIFNIVKKYKEIKEKGKKVSENILNILKTNKLKKDLYELKEALQIKLKASELSGTNINKEDLEKELKQFDSFLDEKNEQRMNLIFQKKENFQIIEEISEWLLENKGVIYG